MATTSFSGVVLYDGTSGERLGTIDHDATVESLAVAPDGSRLAVASRGSGLYCSDVTVYRTVQTSPTEMRFLMDARVESDHDADVTALAFSPDAECLISASAYGTIEYIELS